MAKILLSEWSYTVMLALEELWYKKANLIRPIGDAPNRYVETIGANLVFEHTGRHPAGGMINIYDIFKTKESYIKKELDWYMSQSTDVKLIGMDAKTWLKCCDDNYKVNSNYGFLMFSPQNGYQYKNVVDELSTFYDSRRAVAYYTNPWMHYVGGKDHICTLAVQYLLREDYVHAIVFMRSNDIVYGLIGADLFWQNEMLQSIAADLSVLYTRQIKAGSITWQVGSLHIYEKHWGKLDEAIKLFRQ